MQRELDVAYVAAVNNDEVLAQNLATSPDILKSPDRLTVRRDFRSAASAYNSGLDATSGEIVVFLHQDVYLPLGWEARLLAQIEALETVDRNWGVIGVYGVRDNGTHLGRVWSSGLNRELGGQFDAPEKALGIDELVIVIRRSSGLRFDEGLPGFHLYGADICQTARSNRLGVYVICAPVIHNSVPVYTLAGAYKVAYAHIRRKWWAVLPIVTPVATVSRWGVSLWRINYKLSGFGGRRAKRRRLEAEARPRRDAVAIAKTLGYE